MRFEFTPSSAVTNICCSDTCSSSGPGGSSECCPTQCIPIPCYVGSISVTISYTEAECAVNGDCDDGNPCTNDTCVSELCSHTNNSAACNDGVFCNGADTCSGGACNQHAGTPCDSGELCDEQDDACDADCNANSTPDEDEIGGLKTYDASLGTLPSAQGWTLETDLSPPGDFHEMVDDPADGDALLELHDGPTTAGGNHDWMSNSLPIDFQTGFRFDAHVKVVRSTRDDSPYSIAGFVMAVTDDAVAGASHVFYVYIADSPQRIILATGDNSGSCVNADGSGGCTNGSAAGFPDVNQYNRYHFVVEGGAGSLYVNGQATALISAAVGSRTQARNHQVWFGDNNSRTWSETYLKSFSYANALKLDCNANQVPDECDAPTLTSAVSATPNPNAATGGLCLAEAVLSGDCHSEPHVTQISTMYFTFSGNATAACLSSIEQATCAAPDFAPYTGIAVPACTPGPGTNDLTCTFTPALENARTYRFNLTGGSARIRGLIGDATGDGLVNAADRSAVVGAWTGPGSFSCATDLNSDGITNAADRSIVVGAWTSPQNCAPCPDAGSGEGAAMAGPSDGSGAEESSSGGSGAVIEVRAVGGTVPINVLWTNTPYELRYRTVGHGVQGYTLGAGTSGAAGLGGVEPAEAGPWAGSGLFSFVRTAGACDGAEIPLDGLPGPGHCDIVMSDLADSADAGASEGVLCRFTVQDAGGLELRLMLYAVDAAQQMTYEAEAVGFYFVDTE